MAGAIAEISRYTLAKDFRHINPSQARIILVEGDARILASFPEDLSASALKQLVEEDLHRGFKPLAVVATVGTTSTASVDPIKAIARLCREHGMWLHIDAAYGGGLALLPEAAAIRE